MSDQIKLTLSGLITSSRFQHSCRVADTSRHLAESYSLNSEHAYLAGLIHDAAKDFSPTSSDIQFNANLMALYHDFPAVWHAFALETVAAHFFALTDPNIIQPATWHCTGKANMSELEKVVFIADYIEPQRPFSNRQTIQDLAYNSLDHAVLAIVSSKLTFLIEKQAAIYPDTLQCYHFYLESTSL